MGENGDSPARIVQKRFFKISNFKAYWMSNVNICCFLATQYPFALLPKTAFNTFLRYTDSHRLSGPVLLMALIPSLATGEDEQLALCSILPLNLGKKVLPCALCSEGLALPFFHHIRLHSVECPLGQSAVPKCSPHLLL